MKSFHRDGIVEEEKKCGESDSFNSLFTNKTRALHVIVENNVESAWDDSEDGCSALQYVNCKTRALFFRAEPSASTRLNRTRRTQWQLHNIDFIFFLQHPKLNEPSSPMGNGARQHGTMDCQPFFWSLIQHKSHSKNICLGSKHMCHILLSEENNRKSIKIKWGTGARQWASGV